jgi:hypothetical protein
MNNKLLSMCVGAMLALGAASAWAEKKIDVGRLTAVFQEAGWEGGADLPYNHEFASAQGTFRGKGKVFSLAAADAAPLVVMYVGATYPQTNVYTPHASCGKAERTYVRDLNQSNFENVRCLSAGGPYPALRVMDALMPNLTEAAKTEKVVFPDRAFFVRTYVTAKGGFLLEIEVLLAPSFQGLAEGKPVADLPANLPADFRPGVAAWADKLAENAIKALTSFSGNLVVPPVEFSNATK